MIGDRPPVTTNVRSEKSEDIKNCRKIKTRRRRPFAYQCLLFRLWSNTVCDKYCLYSIRFGVFAVITVITFCRPLLHGRFCRHCSLSKARFPEPEGFASEAMAPKNSKRDVSDDSSDDSGSDNVSFCFVAVKC